METSPKPSRIGRKMGISPLKAPKTERPSSRRRRRATTYARGTGTTKVAVNSSQEQRLPKRNLSTRPGLSRRKASCPEILLSRKDLTNMTLPELVKLVKIGEADLGTLALLGLFPLHEAVAKGIVEIVLQLVDNSRDVNLPSKEGLTPLDVAVQTGNFECAEVLITHGASMVEIQDGFRRQRNCKT